MFLREITSITECRCHIILLPTVNSTDASSETASSGYYIIMPYAQGIQKLDDVRDTVTVEGILTTSDSAYSKTNLQSETLEKEDGDVEGPFALGVSIKEDVGDGKKTQIIYYSSSYIMDSQMNQLVSGGNEKLVTESLNSMVSTEENNHCFYSVQEPGSIISDNI